MSRIFPPPYFQEQTTKPTSHRTSPCSMTRFRRVSTGPISPDRRAGEAVAVGGSGQWEEIFLLSNINKCSDVSGSVRPVCTSTNQMMQETCSSSSTPPTASTARPATSRTALRTSTGSVLRVAAARLTTGCEFENFINPTLLCGNFSIYFATF